MPDRYLANPTFEEELSVDPRFRRTLEIAGHAAVVAARAAAPKRTGRYAASIQASPAKTYGRAGKVRVRIGSDLPYARSIEFGRAGRNPRRAPLLRGSQAVGLRLTSRARKIAAGAVTSRSR